MANAHRHQRRRLPLLEIATNQRQKKGIDNQGRTIRANESICYRERRKIQACNARFGVESPMAARANLPEGTYYDWMHSLVSSGGVAQYEVSQLVRRLIALSEDGDATVTELTQRANEWHQRAQMFKN